MREVKYSSALGKQLFERGCRFDGHDLRQVYDKWSDAKQRAYDRCFDQYLNTDNHDAFSICSHNTFGFSCSWVGTKDGENIMRYEAKDNSYLVYLDR